MKLLILLITLLVRTTLSRPTTTTTTTTTAKQKSYNEILDNLQKIEKEIEKREKDTLVFLHSTKIQAPEINISACECEIQFKRHLNESMKKIKGHLKLPSVDSSESSDASGRDSDIPAYMQNIIDILNNMDQETETVKCSFHNKIIDNVTNFSTFIKKNIHFIQHWNSCKSQK